MNDLDFSEGVEALGAEKLSSISKLANALRAAQAFVAAKEAELKAALAALAVIEQQALPEAMAVLGMKDFTLESGEKLEVKTTYHCSIPEASRPEAFAWLRDNNSASLIKRTVSAQFGRGEDALAAETYGLLRKVLPADARIEDKTYVHPQTLAAFVRERIESKQEVPKELFGVFEMVRAVITQPKTRRGKFV